MPRPPNGGGDDGRYPDSNLPNYGARLRRARLGLICAIATVSMVFVSLTSAYIVRRGLPTFDESSRTYFRDWGSVQLPWLLLTINTALLLISSLTIEKARRNITRSAALAPVRSIPGISLDEERSFPWLGVTILLGFGFLIGQWMAWGELKGRGFFVNTNPNSSFIYLLTAAHAVHLAGGVVAMLWAGATSLLHRPVEGRRIAVDVTAWYWHFMAVLWLYIFALLAFVH
ncbi:MAG: Heme/copper-type cytochrome/quinol oxidase subunit 3-like protein [Candidatus Sulfotelmatobacter sp.]|nr:Heme/copper-type cytochrome/quinol oxidase subunit 3-like protein [Candidatus Sulfotelmatobacter sp.]